MATINYCNYEIKGTLSTTGTITSGGIITAPGGNSSQWNTGYANSITGFSDSGSSTITLTLTQQDGGTLTTSFSNPQGTVKSVGISHAGNAFNTGSAVTTNGTLAITMAGNSTQYVNGAGDLVGFPSIPQGDITGVIAGTGMSGGGLSGTVTLNCLITNNNQLTNGAGYTTDTGTTTPSNTQTFTNKSGNISQWTNDDGYTTNTGTMSGFGVAAAIGGSTFTITNGQTLSLVGGTNITAVFNSSNESITFNNDITSNSQLTNGAGYITAGSLQGVPAILSNGSVPSLNTGISAAEVRTLIGAGTTSSTGTVTSVTVQGNTGLSGSGTVTTSGSITLTNADRGSSQNIFKNVAVSGQSTVVADTNNDTLTFVGAGGMTITTDASSDTITFNPNDDNTNNFVTGGSISGATLSLTRSGLSTLSISGIPTNNNQLTNGAGYITSASLPSVSNAVISVTTAAGLDGASSFTLNGGAATVALSLDLNELAVGGTLVATDSLVAVNGGINNKQLISSIPLSIFNNNAGFITSASLPTVNNPTVTFSAGSGLSGGGSITMNQSNSETITFNGFTNNNQLSNGAGYIGIGSVAITSNGSTPSLGSGISALEVRNLIGAGTSSSAGVTSVATGAGLTGGTITSTGTITNTDRGSSQAIFKNFAASSGGTATANSNNDTLTIAAGSNVTTVRSGDTITINATNDGQGVTSVATGGGLTGGTITSTGTLSHADTSSQGSVNNSGNTYIQDVSLDTYGHVTSLTSATTTLATLGYTGATNANYITNNNQLANGAGYNGFTNNNQLTNGRGFVTSSGNTTIGTSTNISTPGSTVISTVSLTQGVVTAFTTRAMTLANLGYTGATNANNITNNNQLTNGAGYITSAGNQGTVTSIGVTLPVLANGSSSGTITTSGTISLRKPVSGSWHNGGAITVGSDGLSEIGRYLDFHTSNTSTADFDVRLNATSGLLTCSGSFSSTGNISAVGNFVGGYVLVGYGSKGLPTHTFNGDTNTGMFRSNTNEVALTAGGAQNLTCTNTYVKLDGNVGIGTVPSTKLHVDGTALIRDGNGVGDFYIGNLGSSRFIRFHTNNSDTYFDMNCGNILWRQGSSVRFQHTMSSGTFISSGAQIAFGAPSDIRLKENIKPIESALDKVTKLQGVTFDWKKQDIANIKEDIGFIAQDVKKVVPELVREERDGMLSMRHQGVAPLLVEAIKELKAEIEELKKIINKK